MIKNLQGQMITVYYQNEDSLTGKLLGSDTQWIRIEIEQPHTAGLMMDVYIPITSISYVRPAILN